MKILSFQIRETNYSGWTTNEIEFGDINLIVGNSGSGKSILLKSIFEMGTAAIGAKDKAIGSWLLTMDEGGCKYTWDICFKKESDNNYFVSYEEIGKITNGEKTIIVKRDETNFTFVNDKLPKLSKTDSAIYLLQDEELIKPIFKGLSNILKRDFSSGELKQEISNYLLDINLKEKIGKEKDFAEMANLKSLNDRLDILQKYQSDIFDKICETYTEVFGFIKEMKIINHKTNMGVLPILSIKEKNTSDWISLQNLSSGMQKVLYILTDVFTLPQGAVYLIDEYENSLGLNAVDFFPSFIIEHYNNNQYFITSHHPYIINNIPVKNWYVCHRKGQEIKVKYGAEMVERFGSSKQKAYINLINDPFFTEGIE